MDLGNRADSETIEKKRNVVQEIYFGEVEDHDFHFIHVEFKVL